VDGSSLVASQPVTVGVRPEHLTLRGRGDENAASSLALTREVVLTERLGEQTYVHLDAPDGRTLIAKVAGDARVERGARMSFGAPASACHLFGDDGFAIAPLQSIEHYA